mmetsp:Transcript_34319/g.98837  ORF Transcript_34319/g.98837 Transcript_34319/m.98837 type:complete len:269 (-) Transcript_34319:929-1735(-)
MWIISRLLGHCYLLLLVSLPSPFRLLSGRPHGLDGLVLQDGLRDGVGTEAAPLAAHPIAIANECTEGSDGEVYEATQLFLADVVLDACERQLAHSYGEAVAHCDLGASVSEVVCGPSDDVRKAGCTEGGIRTAVLDNVGEERDAAREIYLVPIPTGGQHGWDRKGARARTFYLTGRFRQRSRHIGLQCLGNSHETLGRRLSCISNEGEIVPEPEDVSHGYGGSFAHGPLCVRRGQGGGQCVDVGVDVLLQCGQRRCPQGDIRRSMCVT